VVKRVLELGANLNAIYLPAEVLINIYSLFKRTTIQAILIPDC
jgi:hypothetical protein